MKTKLLVLICLVIPVFVYSQDCEKAICTNFPEQLTEEEEKANSIVNEILNKMGIAPKFRVRKCDLICNFRAVNDANNTTLGKLILFNSNYMDGVKDWLSADESELPEEERDWVAIALLAHELDHHLSDHLLPVTKKMLDKDKEKHADIFSGKTLKLMGCPSLELALQAVKQSSNHSPESTQYYPRAERIKHVTEGYNSVAGNKNNSEYFAIVKSGNKWAFINTNGDYVSSFYDEIEQWSSEGLIVVKNNDKYGYLDQNFNNVIPCIYDKADGFSDGLALVQKDNKAGYIDKIKNIVIPFKFDPYPYSPGHFSEGFAKIEQNRKEGYIDKSGKIVIQCEYDFVNDFNEGFAWVRKGNEEFYIDKNNRRLKTNLQVEPSGEFSEGLACVRCENKKYGFINNTGVLVIDCKYSGTNGFKNGVAIVYDGGSYVGLIDSKGKEIIPLKYSNYDGCCDFSEGLLMMEDESGVSYFNTKGVRVIHIDTTKVWGIGKTYALPFLMGKHLLV